MASSSLIIAVMASLLFSSTMGHSQMRCAKYNTATGNCEAPIRNSGSAFLSEAYDMSANARICQSPITNPINAAYASGPACPDYAPCTLPMGTYTPGETFTVMWFARNHATAEQTPGNVSLYLSPPTSLTAGSDATAAQFAQNKFCTAPFTSCNGKNGDTVQCTTQCTMPANTAAGIYTIWWKWAWPGHTQVYSTCADIYVVGKSNSPSPAQPAPTPVQPAPTPVQPAPAPVQPAPVPAPVTPKPPVVTPPPVSSGSVGSSGSSGSSACSGNNMKCLSATAYSMCNRGSWGAPQTCGPKSMCTPSGDYIYCVASSSPVTAPVPTPTPVVTPVPTQPSTPSTPSSSAGSPASGSCVLGDQVCFGSDQYQTCGNGRSGPEWAVPQRCLAGLSCHPSSTANNVYCY